MANYLDTHGLAILWGDIVDTFARKATATQSADGLMSSADKTKLDGIESGANVYELPEMSPTIRGGAKLGSGLTMDGDVLSVALESESDGSDAGPIVELTAKGHAEQATTTGKNLVGTTSASINSDNVSDLTTYTTQGLTYTRNADGSITVAGTATSTLQCRFTTAALAGGTYTMSGFPSGVSGSDLYPWDIDTDARPKKSDGTNAESDYGNGSTFVVPDGHAIYVIISIGIQTTINATFYPQLELGSTATEYEPYTGGAPSPSPDYPQEIQVVRGHEVTGKTGRYVDLVVKQGDTTLSTTPIPLPSRGWVGALPDGTADTLTLDGAGKVVWERATDEVVLDGSIACDYGSASTRHTDTWRARVAAVTGMTSYNASSSHFTSSSTATWVNMGVGQFYLDNSGIILGLPVATIDTAEKTTAWLSTHPVTVLYPLATPVAEDMGYVEGWTNDFPEGCVLSIPELDDLGVKYCVDGVASTLAHQWYERAKSEYEDRIIALESAVAELIAGA